VHHHAAVSAPETPPPDPPPAPSPAQQAAAPVELDYLPAVATEATAGQKLAWVLYDWANSGFGLIFGGPIFTAVFIGTLLPAQPTWERDPSLPADQTVRGLVIGRIEMGGDSLLALLVALVALLTCIGAPVLGALADLRGWQKGLFILFAAAGAVLAMSTAILLPGDGQGRWLIAAVVYVASMFCFSISNTYYNAFLPRLTRPERQGSLSGWGFAAGYIGGAVALVFAGLVLPRLGWGVGLMLAVGGAWWLVFSIPAFILLPRIPASPEVLEDLPGASAAKSVLTGPFRRVFTTLKHLRQFRMLFLFLLAFLLYTNGTETIIYLSPAFGKTVLGMGEQSLTVMFLIVQGVAFVGAVACGYLADRIGNKPVIIGTLAIWCGGVLATYFVQTSAQYMLMGCVIGLVLGGVQSSSRAMMSALAPDAMRNEAFGFYAVGSKAMAILGPLLYAGMSALWGPRAAVFAVLPFLLAGLLILLPVREPRPARESATPAA
jgi:UMF1 family MFS transporter